jgi:GNAT superfamily N-acetyltransferase
MPSTVTPDSDDKKQTAAEESPAKLHVRLVESVGDLELTRPVSIELHEESRYSSIPYSHKKRDDLFMKAIQDPDHYGLIIAEYKQEAIGFLFCTIGEYLVGYRDLMTTVFSFYVRKKYRNNAIGGKAAMRMLNGAVHWSKIRNAREFMIHATSGIDRHRTDKLLRHTGFKEMGTSYSLKLPSGDKGK